jgi:glutamine amidotransferase-like uncharacterized protein
MQSYRLLIVAGGNFVDMGNSLAAGTTGHVRNAMKGGLNYLGICAGGFLAGSFPTPYKGFDRTSGVKFGFYSAEKNGNQKAAVRIRTAKGAALDQYWEDGPELQAAATRLPHIRTGNPPSLKASPVTVG